MCQRPRVGKVRPGNQAGFDNNRLLAKLADLVITLKVQARIFDFSDVNSLPRLPVDGNKRHYLTLFLP